MGTSPSAWGLWHRKCCEQSGAQIELFARDGTTYPGKTSWFYETELLHCLPCLFDVIGRREAGGQSHRHTRLLSEWGLFSLSPTSFDELVSSLKTCSFTMKLPTSQSGPRPNFQETFSGLHIPRWYFPSTGSWLISSPQKWAFSIQTSWTISMTSQWV